MKKILLVCLTLCGCLGSLGVPVDRNGPRRSALLLLDLQRDFLEEGGRLPIESPQVQPVLDTATQAVQDARAAGVPVIRVHNAFSALDVPGNLMRRQAAIRGSSGATADPRVPAGEDAYFEKQFPDAFTNAELDSFVLTQHINHLVVVGVFADQCVQSTVQGAVNRRMDVTVLRSGVGAATAGKRDHAVDEMERAGAVILDSAAAVDW